MQEFLFVTHSRFKLAEAERILQQKLVYYPLDLPELQAVDVEEVVVHKVHYAYNALQRPVMVEDTGLYLEAWNGLPGALVKWFVQRVGDRGLCEMMNQFSDRSAYAKTVIATYDGEELDTFVGMVAGTIAPAPVGEHGHGWDTLFIPEQSTRTFAEMAGPEKDRYSMRRIAFEAMAHHYNQQIAITP